MRPFHPPDAFFSHIKRRETEREREFSLSPCPWSWPRRLSLREEGEKTSRFRRNQPDGKCKWMARARFSEYNIRVHEFSFDKKYPSLKIIYLRTIEVDFDPIYSYSIPTCSTRSDPFLPDSPEESRFQLPNRYLSLSRPRIGKRRICDVRDLGVVVAKAVSNAEDISRRSAIMLGRGSRWRIDGSRELGCWVGGWSRWKGSW